MAIEAMKLALEAWESGDGMRLGEEHMKITMKDLLGTVELERRVVPDGYQSRVIKRDKNGVVTEVGAWQGPFVLETDHG